MGSKIEYEDSSLLYATDYVRNVKGYYVLWGISAVCYMMLVAVTFIPPEWIGDTTTSENPACLGLLSSCDLGYGVSSAVEDCQGKLDGLSMILGAVSVFIAVTVIVMLLLQHSVINNGELEEHRSSNG